MEEDDDRCSRQHADIVFELFASDMPYVGSGAPQRQPVRDVLVEPCSNDVSDLVTCFIFTSIQ